MFLTMLPMNPVLSCTMLPMNPSNSQKPEVVVNGMGNNLQGLVTPQKGRFDIPLAHALVQSKRPMTKTASHRGRPTTNPTKKNRKRTEYR